MTRPRRVLAICSGGGHWIQMQAVAPAFEHHDVTYATVSAAYASETRGRPLLVVNDANRWNKLGLVRLVWSVFTLVVRLRPQVVVTTGAAPGLFGVFFGRLLGARTIWIDSAANIERISLSARLARPFLHRCLTQWPELARPGGPEYRGSVL